MLEFSSEEVGWCVGRLKLEVERSAVGSVWDAVAAVGDGVVDSVGDVVAKVEDGAVAFTTDVGRMFVDSVLNKPLSISGT